MTSTNPSKDGKSRDKSEDKFKTAPRMGGTSQKTKATGMGFALDLGTISSDEFSDAVGGKSGSSSDSKRPDRISTEAKKKSESEGRHTSPSTSREAEIRHKKEKEKEKESKGDRSSKKDKDKDKDAKRSRAATSAVPGKERKNSNPEQAGEVSAQGSADKAVSPRRKFFGKEEKKDTPAAAPAAKDQSKPKPEAKPLERRTTVSSFPVNGGKPGEDGNRRAKKEPGTLVARRGGDELFKKKIEDQLKRSLTQPEEFKSLGLVKVGTGEEVEEWDPDARKSILTPILENDASLEAFAHAGEKPGLEIWRIEKMTPVRWPKKKYGKFHCMDSYICLSTAYATDGSRNMEWSLHYWIGRKAPKDSYAAAAFRSIQLNQKTGGLAVHYRETQGHESEKFQQYFRYNIKYLKGGAGSALVQVQEEIHETRLLQLLGTKSVVRQVDAECASLNEGDVFVLDTGGKLYVWVGKTAGAVKKAKGMEIANMINAENKGKGEVIVLAGPERDNEEGFWKSMGGTADEIAAADEALTDSEVIQDLEESIFLYKAASVDGEMQAMPVEATPLTKELLESTETYILDCETEMFIWVGKNSLWENKAGGLMLAEDILTMFERPAWTPMTRMVEGNETVLFKSKFHNWVTLHPGANSFDKVINTLGSIAPTLEQPKIDVKRMHDRPVVADFVPNEDEDSGILEIWTIPIGGDKSSAEAVPEAEVGEFYAGRCFIILYSYMDDSKVKSISYFWEGQLASASDYIAYDHGLYERLVEKMEDEGGGPPKKIRYRQYAEGEFFLSLFENTMIIHFGDGESEAEYAMYDIRGTSPRDTRAVEVEAPQAQYLNSMCCFVLTTPDRAYVWYGTGSNPLFRSMADHVCTRLRGNKEVLTIKEGQEPPEFWRDIGGKAPYATADYLTRPGGYPWGYPRMFQCSEATGVFVVDEILSFSQESLDPSDVMLLDGYYEIYAWIGTGATEKEVTMSIETAKEYISLLPDDRIKNIPLHVIRQGEEPIIFKGFFREWKTHANLAEEIDAMRQARKEYIEAQRFEPASPLQAEFFNALAKRDTHDASAGNDKPS